MAKGWALSTGNLPRRGFPRNSVDRITDRPDMTSAVDRGRKALTQLTSFFRSHRLRCFGASLLQFKSVANHTPGPAHRDYEKFLGYKVLLRRAENWLSTCIQVNRREGLSLLNNYMEGSGSDTIK